MTNSDKTIEALQRLRPGAQWVLRGDELEWMDEEQTEPTAQELADEIGYLESPEYEKEKWRKDCVIPLYKLEGELEERGLLSTVETLLQGSSKKVQIAWMKSPTVRRMSPTVLTLAQHPSLALTAEDLDDIFEKAQLIEL